jgi:acyl carrier protein
MRLEELVSEITELMQIEGTFKLEEPLNSYPEWDSMVVLSVLALLDDEFSVDASDKLIECTTFQDVVNIVSNKLDD